jgi:hypothetical protein
MAIEKTARGLLALHYETLNQAAALIGLLKVSGKIS